MKKLSCTARNLSTITVLLAAAILLPSVAAAVPSYCDCPPSANQSVWGELKQNTCTNLDTNLYLNLRSYANGQCSSGGCGACFYSYSTDYPSCTITSDGFYTQSGTLTYACGFSVGPV